MSLPEIGTKGVLEGFDTDGKAITRTPARPITLRHLLTHTSGLGYDTWNADIMKYRQVTAPRQWLVPERRRSRRRCCSSRASSWEYGISIDWVGQLVEAASGQRLDRYMTERLFTPLGMNDTGFAIGPAQRPRKAKMHAATPTASTPWSTRSRRRRSSTWAVAALFDGRRIT